MTNFDTEAQFVAWLTDKLKADGYLTTRIESHSTGNGIPDLFVQGRGTDFWIEAKNNKGCFGNKHKVSWRPGQQSWFINYFGAHRNKCVVTLNSFKNGLAIIPNVKVFKGNIVEDPFFLPWTNLKEIKHLGWLIQAASYVQLFAADDHTPRLAMIDLMDKLWPTADYDPEVIIPEDVIDLPCSMSWFNRQQLEYLLETGLY